jgi:hypothetical protein
VPIRDGAFEAGFLLADNFPRAESYEARTGAGRRVKLDRRGQQGEEKLDATTGDIPWNLDSRVSLPSRLRLGKNSPGSIMADANSIAKSQQEPGDRPKNHLPREPVLQVIGDLFQSFALSHGAGFNFPPFACGIFHLRFDPPGDDFRVHDLKFYVHDRLLDGLAVFFCGGLEFFRLCAENAGKSSVMVFVCRRYSARCSSINFRASFHQRRQIGSDAPLRLGQQGQLHRETVVRPDAPFI